MAFYVDDIPAEAFVIEPPETINLVDFNESEARLFDPTGTASEPLSSTPDLGLDAVIVDFPNDESLFTVEGVYRLRIVLTGLTGYRQGMPDVPLVVQDPLSEWHTLDSARGEWADAEHLSDAMLYQLLADVREQVLEFAPALFDAEGEPLPVPARYRRGQLVQARNTLNAQGVDPANGEDGNDTFAIRPFPLDWQVKQILRPKRGIPVVG